jgi:hypothetical protein
MSRTITSGKFYHGSKGSIGGTALQLTSTVTPLLRGITVKADAANSTAFVYVGNSNVTAGIAAPTTDGFKLAAGESVSFEIDDVSKVWVIGSTTGLAVSWIGD